MPRGLTNYDNASIQGQLWTPQVLRPRVWFDLSESYWVDKSGNGRNGTVHASVPPVAEAAHNGRKAVRFSGTERINFDSSFFGNSPYSAGIVFARDNGGGDDTVFSVGTASGSDAVFWMGYFNTNSFGFSQWINNMDINTSNFPAWSGRYPECAVGSRNSTTSFPGGNARLARAFGGVLWSSSNTTLLLNTSAADGRVGVPAVANPFNGDVCEMVLFDYSLSLYEITLLEGYFNSKWDSVSFYASHEYASRPPLVGG